MKLSETNKFNTFNSFNVGSNAKYNIFCQRNKYENSTECEYFKYNYENQLIETFEIKSKVVTRSKSIFIKSHLVGNIIYELYSTNNPSSVQKLLLLKRNGNDFSKIGDLIQINETNIKDTPIVDFFMNENGCHILQKNHIKDEAYIITLDKDLNKVSTFNLSSLYPEGFKSKVKEVTFQESGHLIFKIDPKSIEDKFFGSTETSEETTLAILIITPEGEIIAVRPILKENVRYSGFSYKYNEDENTLLGIFTTRNKGGEGYLYIKWDADSGEILEQNNTKLKISDFVNEEVIEHFYKTFKKEYKPYNPDDNFYTLDDKPNHIFLDNGYTLIEYKSFRISPLHTTKPIRLFTNFWSSQVTICLDKHGKIMWSNFHPNLVAESSQIIGNKDNIIVKLSTERSINYTNKIYNKGVKTKGDSDIIAITTIDLNTGKTIKRKQIGELEATAFYNTKWNKTSNQIQLIMSKMNKNFINLQFTFAIVNYDDIK